MGLEFDDTNGITQGTDFTGQDQAASDPGPAPVSENSNQPDGWATGQSQDIGDMFHRFSPQQQLMASKIGLFGNRNLPTDASGRTSYNAFKDSTTPANPGISLIDQASSGNPGSASQTNDVESKRKKNEADGICGDTAPVPPPGVSIEKNIETARDHCDPFWFRDQVGDGGPWDFKRKYPGMQAFGNYHYGRVGMEFCNGIGFPPEVLQRMAGWNQFTGPNHHPSFGAPWGPAPYGDDPKDQDCIEKGIDDSIRSKRQQGLSETPEYNH